MIFNSNTIFYVQYRSEEISPISFVEKIEKLKPIKLSLP